MSYEEVSVTRRWLLLSKKYCMVVAQSQVLDRQSGSEGQWEQRNLCPSIGWVEMAGPEQRGKSATVLGWVRKVTGHLRCYFQCPPQVLDMLWACPMSCSASTHSEHTFAWQLDDSSSRLHLPLVTAFFIASKLLTCAPYPVESIIFSTSLLEERQSLLYQPSLK